MKVLVAPNSFKECANSVEISELIKKSLFRYLPDQIHVQMEYDIKPVSDGGDGFLEVCKRSFGLEFLHFEISNPFNNEKFFCPIGYFLDSKTLYIESAEVLGLKNIPLEFRKPTELSSKGMGELLLQILEGVETGIMEVDKLIVGIGGTGTNDLGMGMLEVFGLEFYDKSDKRLEVLPKNFAAAHKIVVPEIQLPFKIELVIDIENPLLGIEGACLCFSEQKGASDEEAVAMEEGFTHLLYELEVDDATQDSLSGAGGGLAAAFKLFFNAHEKFASDFIRQDLGITSDKHNYDLVITGEGKLDFQTFLNKGSMIIAKEFETKNIPIYFICGVTDGDLPKIENLHVIELSEFFNSVDESIQKIDKGIDQACRRISKGIIQSITKKNNS